jgi:predicted DCC family thiol-disulfide oxidoreductase YuxK
MRALTVLYDAGCGFCVRCRRWLEKQPHLVELDFVPAGSFEARSRFPTLHHDDELVVVDDRGGVYEGSDAWLICLYALTEYREWSYRLARPGLRPLARAGFEWLSRNRRSLSRQLRLAPEEHVRAALAPLEPTSCAPRTPGEACDIPRRTR